MSKELTTRKKSSRIAEDIDHIDGLPFYPQYCFRLSPTVNTYPHLQISDIDALTTHAGFGGQNVFFHLNHPIRWVRVSGIVVAVDEYPGRRIFTLDDSSGVCIECTIEVPKSDAALAAAITANTAATSQDSAVKPDSKGQALPGASRTAAPSEPPPKAVVPAEVDVGTVIDVKGGLALFRGQKQIKILKATVLRCTEHEVAFWEKVAQFRRDVLEKPWQLTDKEVRRCRKDEERRK